MKCIKAKCPTLRLNHLISMMPNQQFLILGLYLVTACNLAVGDRVVETAEAFLTSSEVSTLCKESVDIFVSQLSEPLTSLTKEGFWALKSKA